MRDTSDVPVDTLPWFGTGFLHARFRIPRASSDEDRFTNARVAGLVHLLLHACGDPRQGSASGQEKKNATPFATIGLGRSRRQAVDDQLHVEVFYAALGPLFAWRSKRSKWNYDDISATVLPLRQVFFQPQSKLDRRTSSKYPVLHRQRVSRRRVREPNWADVDFGTKVELVNRLCRTSVLWRVCTATERCSKLPGLLHVPASVGRPRHACLGSETKL